MSFILDALRKSEHERQRQAGPGLVELRPAIARPTLPIWAIALAALLAINLIVLGVLMLRGDGTSAPAAVALPDPQIPSPPAAAPLDARSSGATPLPYPSAPANAARPAAADSYVIADPASSLPDSPAIDDDYGDAGTESASEEPIEPGPELQPPPRAQAAGSEESIARLPTLNDMSLQGASVPELHLDIHVYATQPAERFVFLNNRKYREGGETPDGTRIERITRDGVVLNHRGVRFLLPRQ
jgi:general secretion pathway protein B